MTRKNQIEKKNEIDPKMRNNRRKYKKARNSLLIIEFK